MGQDPHEDEDTTSKPFQGVVVCCTSIPPDQRTDIAKRTTDMGGIHKYDLTPNVTHLIVGEYDTPKYRHVAKERPDIVPMTTGWIYEAREMWMADQEFNFAALEAKWRLKTFESGGGDPESSEPASRENKRLLCCLTGFEDHDMRSMIEEKVRANGGEYVGDLSKKVTHLITYKPEGKKYKAAVNWGIRTVSIEWLHDSVERGMILNEDCYDPTLPEKERGVGAWTRKEVRRDTTGKRLRDDATATTSAAQGRRKLRKTASLKLISQNESLWGDILNQQSPANHSMVDLGDDRSSLDESRITANESMLSKLEEPTQQVGTVPPKEESKQPEGASGVFASCRFFVHNFSPGQTEIIRTHLVSNGGRISTSVDDVASPAHPEPPTRRFLLVAQTSQPDSHPTLPEGVHIVTEFYIERCVHGKRLAGPDEHVLGRPFPRFPVPGFEELTVSTTGFKDEQLHQVYKAVTQLGARYEERLKATASLLVTPSLDHVYRQKLEFARRAGIPVVDAEWLWQCIRTGFLAPWDKYLLQKLEKPDKPNSTIDSATDSASAAATKERLREKRRSLQKTTSEPAPMSRRPPAAGTSQPVSMRPPPRAAGVDRTAFEDDGPAPAEESFAAGGESHYDTARTHQPPSETTGTSTGTALRDASSNALNKSPSSPQQKAADALHPAPRRQSDRNFKRVPTGGTVADSDGSDSVGTSRHGTEPPPDDEATAAASTRTHEWERERQEKAAREKEEMSRRLNSLMSSHKEDGAGSGNGQGSDANSGGSGGLAFDENIAGLGGGGEGGGGPRPQRRKREVLGRAISNVSTASSNASAESPSASAGIHHAHLKTPAAAAGSFSGTGGSAARHQFLDKMLDHTPTTAAEGSPGEGERGRGKGQGQEDGPVRGEYENPPPATQLGYDVPEARIHRAAIMDRMLRRKSGSGAAPAGQDKEEKKATLASVSARMGATGDGGSGTAAPATTRRTTRRQRGF